MEEAADGSYQRGYGAEPHAAGVRCVYECLEEHKKNGVISYKEISPLDFYNTIYGSFDQEYFLRSGLLPPNCLQVSFCGEDKYFVLWNPELRADISYKGTEYLNFPIPRMVFSIRTLRDGRAVDCSMGVVADEPPKGDTKMYHYVCLP